MKRHPPIKHLSLFFKQLATTVSAGIPVISALELFIKGTTETSLKPLASDLLKSVENGGSLSDGLRGWKRILSPVIPALIRVGEETGRLDDALTTSSELLEFFHAIRQQILNGLFYPIFLLVLSIFITPIPRLFMANGQTTYLRELVNPLFMLAFFGLSIYAIMKLYQSEGIFGSLLTRFFLEIPVIGPAIRNLATARFARVFSITLQSGLDIATSLTLSADACGNRFITRIIYDSIPQILGGESISSALSRTNQFSSFFCRLVAAGEVSGKLDETLVNGEQMFREAALTSIDRIMKALPPLVLIGVGGYIGYQIIQFWVGYFNHITGHGFF